MKSMHIEVVFENILDCRQWIEAFYDNEIITLNIKGQDIKLTISDFHNYKTIENCGFILKRLPEDA